MSVAPPAARKDRVLLVSMPMGAIERPSLALGLLQAHCTRLAVECDTRYLNIAFADRVGLTDYQWLCSEVPYTAFAGEWLFTGALYGADTEREAGYLEGVLHRQWQLGDADLRRLAKMKDSAEAFIDLCLSSVGWDSYTLVGFTSVFQQNIASLALARRVKAEHPAIDIAFGGANWEEAMGARMRREFPFVDLVFSGEADQSFPSVLEARREGRSLAGIPGIVLSGGAPAVPAARIENLDDVPVPDYDPYFEQLAASPAVSCVTPTLLVETARGCWWGERSHCTFCGLNGATMAFRSKSPERAVEEIAGLCQRYGPRTFSVVDDILDMRYFRTVLPRLAEARLGADFFWEVKANLSPAQVRSLSDAGVRYIQPGIESLDDHVLGLMRKGTTAFRNVELLKWCKEYGVTPLWNLLYGVPGETDDDYERTSRLINAIWHLDPPTGWGPVRLDRFSPYYDDPGGFGMVNVRPMAPFPFLYPFEDRSVAEIAYYFDFDYADGRRDSAHIGNALDLARAWMADPHRGELSVSETATGSVISDTRKGVQGGSLRFPLAGWKAAAYRACDRSHTLGELAELPEMAAEGVDEAALELFLRKCERYQLAVERGGRWLALAVHRPARRGASMVVPRRILALRGAYTGGE